MLQLATSLYWDLKENHFCHYFD